MEAMKEFVEDGSDLKNICLPRDSDQGHISSTYPIQNQNRPEVNTNSNTNFYTTNMNTNMNTNINTNINTNTKSAQYKCFTCG